MDVLLDCIDEIALDGLDGCPIQALWKHLEERRPPFSLKLDDRAKQFVWKAIARTPDIEFFALAEPFPHIFGPKQGERSDNENAHSQAQNPLDQFPGPLRYNNEFKLISEEDTGIRGSCPSYHVRKNISEDVRGHSSRDCVDLETAYERWGDCLVMVASQELREKALLGLECDPHVTLTDIQYCLLEHVGQARYNGRVQKTIGSSFFKMDSRSTFHHLKRLRKRHLVTMQPLVVSTTDSVICVRNFTTNVVRLKRFHVQEHHKYDVLASRLCKLLLDSPSQEMLLSDVQQHFSELRVKVKGVRRVRQFLQQAGYIVEEKIPGPCDTTESSNWSPPKKKKRQTESAGGNAICTVKIRLLKPFVLKTDCIQQPDDANEDDKENSDDDDNDEGDDKRDDGEDAVWSEDYDSTLVAERPLLTQVYNIIQQAGPRGFTLSQCRKTCKLPFPEVRCLIKTLKKKHLIQEVHQDVAKQRVAWFVATPFVESNVQAMKVKQMQDELKEMETKAVDLNIPKEGMDVKDKKPKQNTSGIVERVTYRKLKRKAIILEYLQKVKVVEGANPIQKAVISSEEEEGHQGRIDRKVLFRILDDLCSQGLIKKLNTVIHHGAASQTVDLYMNSSISNNDAEVAVMLEQCRVRLRDQITRVAEKEEREKRIEDEKERKKVEKAAAAEEKQRKKLEKKGKDTPKKSQQHQEKAHHEIDGLDEYALDPLKKYTIFCELPQSLRSQLKEIRRYKPAPLELLCYLCQMGLVTPLLPFPRAFTNIKMFLSKGSKLLDTTKSIPNYKTACPPPGKSFVSRCHMFTSMIAVQSIWSDLKCVCLNTPLGLVKVDDGSSAISDKALFSNKHKRLIHYATEEVDEDKVDFPPGDQLGAAGLDRGFFSHLKKNWTRVMTSSSAVQLKRKLPTSTTIMAAGGNAKNSDSPAAQEDTPTTFWSIGRAEMKQQAKKESIKQEKKKRKRKAEDLQENDEEPGGVKRTRTLESTEKQPENVKERSKKGLYSSKTGHLNAIDEEDRNILARKAVERITFSAEEDSWLLLFRVALGVMKNETSRFYPFVCMRNILHKACTSSIDKTAPNLQRRILKLMKNPQSQMTVKICTAECVHDESFKGFDDPLAEFETTFQEVVKRLRQKFSSSSLSCDGGLTLVCSKNELNNKYKVQVLASKGLWTSSPDKEITSLGPSIKRVSDINKAAIRDQIQIAFTTPQDSYDAYRVFQMFNFYTREELEAVFKEMQKRNLITKKKTFESSGSSQFTRPLPFASMTYQLSSTYHRLFMNGFKMVTFYRDCAHFCKQLISGEQHRFNDPMSSKSLTEETTESFTPGTIELKPACTIGGHVACILSLLATNKVHVEINIPNEILNMDISENAEQQTSETIEDEGKTQSAKPTLHERNEGTSVSLPSAKAGTSESKESPSRKVSQKSTERKKPAIVTPRKRSTSGSSPPSFEEKCKAKGKGCGKGGKEKRLEKCEVFSLSLSSTVAKFTSTYDLVSVKESSNFLTSCTEVSELQSMEAQASKVSVVPVASLSYSSTSSRSSRTALMLARGGKDPYASINQLPARAFNTHDFMTLNPCKIILTLEDGSFQNVADEKNPHHRELAHAEGESKLTPDHSLTTEDEAKMLLNKISNDCCTSPVVVTNDVSIEDYIEQTKQDFGLTASDFPLARIIYSIVAESKEFGTPVEVLQERIHESHKHELSLSQFSFGQQLSFMCKAKLLYKVGSFTCCLVTASFVKPWCVTLLKPKDDCHPKKALDTDRNVSLAGDSLPAVMSISSKLQEQSEGEQNASETAEIYNENSSTAQTNQISSSIAQVANQTASSQPHEVDVSRGNIGTSGVETTGQRSCSTEPAHDSSCNDVKTSEIGRKKYKVRNYEQYSVICRPWITIDGETSQQLLRMFREMVLMLILGNPGISQSQVSKHFFEALRPVALQDILDSLILDGCIVKHVRKLPLKVALFSTIKSQEPSETMTFFTPTVDCVIKLATSKLTGYM